jgi:LCP family protein required for cell wall assembly
MDEEVVKAASKRRGKVLAAVLVGLILLVSIPLLASAVYVRRFLASAGLNLPEVRQIITSAKKKRPFFAGQKVNFLILGLDHRDDELERTLLTDTIIFASFDLKKSRLKLIPLPRDLWIESLKTKVNALYYYGEIDKNSDGPDFLIDQLSLILDQPIRYWLVLDYQNMAELIDTMGGVDVSIKEGFTDNRYPNPRYRGASDSGQTPYLTVSFQAGPTHLDGERALEFVRSRMSTSREEGNDLARSSRQLQLFNGLVNRLKSRSTLLDPQKLGKLYRFWREKMSTNLSDEDLLAILLSLSPRRRLQIEQASIPATYEREGAILVNPPISKHGQWVWEPESGDWSEVQRFVKKFLTAD